MPGRCAPSGGAALRVQAVDPLAAGPGPGVRFAVVAQGCPLRCPGCPVAELSGRAGGRLEPVRRLAAAAQARAPFMAMAGGGVSITGGEPLLQSHGVGELLRRCRSLGLRTAVDTTGAGNPFDVKALLHLTDLLVADVTQAGVIGGGDPLATPAARLLAASAGRGRPVWLLHTLIPGLTDDHDRLDTLAAFAARLDPAPERVIVLPSGRRGGHGLLALCPDPAMRDRPQPDDGALRSAASVFRRHDLRVA